MTLNTSHSGVSLSGVCTNTHVYQSSTDIWSACSFTDSKDMIGANI